MWNGLRSSGVAIDHEHLILVLAGLHHDRRRRRRDHRSCTELRVIAGVWLLCASAITG
jgi:hypothetical protein